MLEDFERGSLKRIYDAKNYPPVEDFVSPRLDVLKHDRFLMNVLQATRGCPYDCEFCSIKHSTGHKYRTKPVKQVIAEIKEYEKYNKKRFGVYKKSYLFVDDNLYVNREYVKELFSAMCELDILWTAQGSINTAFDDEILELMARSGCRGYSIGFESISEETLKEANKPKINKIKDYKAAIDNLIRHGIVPAGFFIFGFDNDDMEVFQKTVDFAISNHIIQPFFSLLTPYPGTRLYDRINGEERIFDRDWQNYNSSKCVFTPKQLEPSKLEKGVAIANKQLARLDVIIEQLRYFWSKGPWTAYKPLGLWGRIVLFLLGLKMRNYNINYQKFLFWVARQKNVNDFGSIIAALVYNDLSRKLTDLESFDEIMER
jgi:radical SAM superfamily enzyme YgiQ (UPF0313 family)